MPSFCVAPAQKGLALPPPPPSDPSILSCETICLSKKSQPGGWVTHSTCNDLCSVLQARHRLMTPYFSNVTPMNKPGFQVIVTTFTVSALMFTVITIVTLVIIFTVNIMDSPPYIKLCWSMTSKKTKTRATPEQKHLWAANAQEHIVI